MDAQARQLQFEPKKAVVIYLSGRWSLSSLRVQTPLQSNLQSMGRIGGCILGQHVCTHLCGQWILCGLYFR